MNKGKNLENKTPYIENILKTLEKISIETSKDKEADDKIKKLSDY